MNQQGFLSTPLSAIVEATGMQKGGIYNHFSDKEELALLAFDECFRQIKNDFYEAASKHSTAPERIKAFITAYCDYGEQPGIPGGCPIMNATVEAGDGQSVKLLDRAQTAMRQYIQFLVDELLQGIEKYEIRAAIDPQKSATLIMATIEGGILLNKLFGDREHINDVKDQLITYVDQELSTLTT